MKRLTLVLIAALLASRAIAAELPSGTFILSDGDEYFGRLTISASGVFTGTLRASFDEAQYGRRSFSGHLEFGGETECRLRYPQATSYRYPYGPSEAISLRHTPDGPSEYVATVRVTVGQRLGPPVTYTYDIPSYRPLEDANAAGFYTLLLRPVPGTGYGDAPNGTGWAVLRLSETGRFRCLGRLANGEAFSFGFDARSDRRLDLFRHQSPATFYPRRGGKLHSEFYGTITLRDVPDVSDADGTMRWECPTPFDEEFATQVSIIASRYLPTRDVLSLFTGDAPPAAEPPLGLATFSDESFPEPKHANFRFETPPVILPHSPIVLDSLNWTPQGSAFPGRFRGVVKPGVGTHPFSGVFFPRQKTAEGFFRNRTGSGVVQLGIGGLPLATAERVRLSLPLLPDASRPQSSRRCPARSKSAPFSPL